MAYYIAPPPCPRHEAVAHSRALAREWLSDPTTVLLDTETTSINGWPIEVAVVSMTGHVLLDTLASPPVPVEDGARAVHGISDEELSGAPPMRRVLDDLAAVLVGRRVLAYNARYDQGVLTRAYTSTVRALPLWRTWGCVMELESWNRGIYADDGRVRAIALEAVEHRALGDCRAALAVLHRLSEGEEQ